jgi:hypothetical protein
LREQNAGFGSSGQFAYDGLQVLLYSENAQRGGRRVFEMTAVLQRTSQQLEATGSSNHVALRLP